MQRETAERIQAVIDVQRELFDDATFHYVRTTNDRRTHRSVAIRDGETIAEYRKRMRRYYQEKMRRDSNPDYNRILAQNVRMRRQAHETPEEREVRLEVLRNRAKENATRYRLGVTKPRLATHEQKEVKRAQARASYHRRKGRDPDFMEAERVRKRKEYAERKNSDTDNNIG